MVTVKTHLLGMAGLAEAAVSAMLLIGYLALLLLGVLAAVGIFRRSRLAASVAILILLMLSYFFQPWNALGVVKSDDPDELMWFARYQAFVCWWLAAALAAVSAAIRAFPCGDSVHWPRLPKCSSKPVEPVSVVAGLSWWLGVVSMLLAMAALILLPILAFYSMAHF